MIGQSKHINFLFVEKLRYLMKKISFGFYRRKCDFSRGRRVVILVSDRPDSPHASIQKKLVNVKFKWMPELHLKSNSFGCNLHSNRRNFFINLFFFKTLIFWNTSKICSKVQKMISVLINSCLFSHKKLISETQISQQHISLE